MRAWIALALLGLILTSCAATLRLQWTFPTQDNAGTCGARVLIPTAGGPCVAHFRGSGPIAFEDSVAGVPGAAGTFTKSGLPSGTYTGTAWITDQFGNASCDTTWTKLLRGSFAPFSDLR